ncbi:unnamed protein product [Polarella glacialis]|uniref:Guanine nucleotide-binding protein subunit beta-like protein n=1 Tax=Polarella glacialis TaxID=89957 RepID=A0A813DT92_POLGL|nr:unnamed protein product [Polarella glacialis]
MFEKLHTFDGHTGCVTDVALSDFYAVTGSSDKTAKIWCLSDGSLTATLEGHKSRVIAVDICTDHVATASDDGVIKLWSVVDGTLKTTVAVAKDAVRFLCLSAHYFVTGGHWQKDDSGKEVNVWSLSGDLKASCYDAKTTRQLRALCISHSQDMIVTARLTTIQVWVNPKPPNGQPGEGSWSWRVKFRMKGHASPIVEMCCSGFLLVSCSGQAGFRVWSLSDGTEKMAAQAITGVSHGGNINMLGLASGYNLIAPSVGKKRLGVWPLAGMVDPSGEVAVSLGKLQIPAQHEWSVSEAAALDARGHHVVVASGNSASVWVTEPGRRRMDSESLGVPLQFLLGEWGEYARGTTQLEDPGFRDLKNALWTGPSPQHFRGSDSQLCPRDLRPGCSIVDVLHKTSGASRATHFMSWSWDYKVSVLLSALRRWENQGTGDHGQTSLWICFFVNNQYRILLEKAAMGSDDLGSVFAARLQACGRVLVLLDKLKDPVYVKRVWCVFETYQATRLKVPLQVILPEEAYSSLKADLRGGRLDEVTKSLTEVNVEDAIAWSKDDEVRIKQEIRETIGYEQVNGAVKAFLSTWVVDCFHHILTDSLEPDTQGAEAAATMEPSSEGGQISVLKRDLATCRTELREAREELVSKGKEIAQLKAKVLLLHHEPVPEETRSELLPVGSPLTAIRQLKEEQHESSDSEASSHEIGVEATTTPSAAACK